MFSFPGPCPELLAAPAKARLLCVPRDREGTLLVLSPEDAPCWEEAESLTDPSQAPNFPGKRR